MMTLFLDIEGLVHTKFMPKDATTNASYNCETLKRLRQSLKNDFQGNCEKELGSCIMVWDHTQKKNVSTSEKCFVRIKVIASL